MNFKKTWDLKYGCTEIITKENSSLDMLEVDMLKLKKGESKVYDVKECSLII